jgi:hypothetical protein
MSIIHEWFEAKARLDAAKALELELRNKIVAAYPGDQGVTRGEGEGFKVKVTRGVSRSVDSDVLLEILDDLTDEERACVIYKPSLDAKRFLFLPRNSVLSRAVIIKPSQPTVEVEFTDGDD